MSDKQVIPDAAVEAALNALGEETYQRATWDEMQAALDAAAPHMAPDPAKCAILPQCLVGAYTDGYCDGMSGDKHNLDKYRPTP